MSQKHGTCSARAELIANEFLDCFRSSMVQELETDQSILGTMVSISIDLL